MSITEDVYTEMRHKMVVTQIQGRGIKDKNVLAAMKKVPRHEFVSVKRPGDAYGDFPLSIGKGQTISQPYIVALMTEQLQLKKTDRVLEIGTGSGYQAAILAEVAGEVYSIEIIESLSSRAGETLKSLGYKNINLKHGDGYRGWPEHAPFDAIMATCAPEEVPQPLIDQLAEGGRLVIPVGPLSGVQDLKILKRTGKRIESSSITGVRFVPMTR